MRGGGGHPTCHSAISPTTVPCSRARVPLRTDVPGCAAAGTHAAAPADERGDVQGTGREGEGAQEGMGEDRGGGEGAAGEGGTGDGGGRGGLTKGLLLTHPRPYCRFPPQSGSPTWAKGAVAASSTLQRVLPRKVTHVRPKAHIPLFRADDTWGSVPSHILINLQILGPKGREPGQRPCPAGTPTWVGFQ